MKKNIRFVIVAIVLMVTCGYSFAFKKTIKSEIKNGIGYIFYREDCDYEWVLVYDRNSQKEGAEDWNGKTIVPISRGYTSVCYHSKKDHPEGGYFGVDKNGYEGVVDLQGREIIPPNRYTSVCYHSEKDHPDGGYFGVDKNGYEGAVDLRGREIIPPNRYTSVCYYSEKDHPDGGYFGVDKNGYEGVVDLRGKEIIPPNRYISIIWVCGYYEGKMDSSSDYKKINVDEPKSTLSASSSSDATFGYYKVSKQCRSKKTGKWIGMLKNEIHNIVIFGEKYIVVKDQYGLGSDILNFWKQEGKWKIYGPHIEDSGKFYYYVDDDKNMQMVLEFNDGKKFDTFTFPMTKE